MPKYHVAHVREQNIDLVIVPLDTHYGDKTENEQIAFIQELQFRVQDVGWAGTVVPVWNDRSGRFKFRAPKNWHPFFGSLNMHVVQRMLNKEIHW